MSKILDVFMEKDIQNNGVCNTENGEQFLSFLLKNDCIFTSWWPTSNLSGYESHT